jgi:hypothetical protein
MINEAECCCLVAVDLFPKKIRKACLREFFAAFVQVKTTLRLEDQVRRTSFHAHHTKPRARNLVPHFFVGARTAGADRAVSRGGDP